MAEATHLPGCDLAHSRRQRCSTWAPPSPEPGADSENIFRSLGGRTADPGYEGRVWVWIRNRSTSNVLWTILNFCWLFILWTYTYSTLDRSAPLPFFGILGFWILAVAGLAVFGANMLYVFRGNRTVPFVGLVAFTVSTLLWFVFAGFAGAAIMSILFALGS